MLLSVIVPVYNGERYLRECIKSVLCVVPRDSEVILVDDGSTDSTPRICKELADSDARVRLLTRERNPSEVGGPGAPRNLGLRHANGEFVTYVDSDDWWTEGPARACFAALEKGSLNADVVMHFFRKYMVSTGGLTDPPLLPQSATRDESEPGLLMKDLCRVGSLYTSASAKILKREFLFEHGITFPEGTAAEDIEWGVKVLAQCRTVQVWTESFYVYRQHSESFSHQIDQSRTLQFMALLERLVFEQEWQGRTEGHREAILGYLASRYVQLLLGVGRIQSSDEKGELMRRARRMKSVLNYALDRRTKGIGILVEVIGPVNVARLLAFTIGIRDDWRRSFSRGRQHSRKEL